MYLNVWDKRYISFIYFYIIKEIRLNNDDMDKHLLIDCSLIFFLDSSKGFLLLMLFFTRFHVSGAREFLHHAQMRLSFLLKELNYFSNGSKTFLCCKTVLMIQNAVLLFILKVSSLPFFKLRSCISVELDLLKISGKDEL